MLFAASQMLLTFRDPLYQPLGLIVSSANIHVQSHQKQLKDAWVLRVKGQS